METHIHSLWFVFFPFIRNLANTCYCYQIYHLTFLALLQRIFIHNVVLTTDLLTLSWFLSMFGLGIHSREFYVSLRCFCTLLHVQAVFVFSLCSVSSVVFLISLVFPFVFSVCHVCSFPSTSVKFTCLCLSLGVRYFPLYFVHPLSCMHMFTFASPASLVRFSSSVFPGVLSDVSVWALSQSACLPAYPSVRPPLIHLHFFPSHLQFFH